MIPSPLVPENARFPRLAVVWLALFVTSHVGLMAPSARALTHEDLRILIVGDEVNPHGLPPGDLTQPADLFAALSDPLNGIDFDPAPDGVRLVATDDLPQATAALSVPFGDAAAYDVLVYFAHRIPNGPSGATDQAAFVAAVEAFLGAGGGVVAFHHGIYRTAGKEAMQALIGGEAVGAVPFDTVTGQRIIDVTGGSLFTQGVVPDGSTTYSDPANGVPAGTYSYFTNVPDERYPNFTLLPTTGTIDVLFASDYDGGAHVLGWLHTQPAWAGAVIAYQPGEYEPNALDLGGNNFRILANAIEYFGIHVAPSDAPEVTSGRTGDLEVWPNPMRDQVSVRRREAGGGAGRSVSPALLVFDAQGRRIVEVPALDGRWQWDGRDASGRRTPAGVYFVRPEGSDSAVRLVRLR